MWPSNGEDGSSVKSSVDHKRIVLSPEQVARVLPQNATPFTSLVCEPIVCTSFASFLVSADIMKLGESTSLSSVSALLSEIQETNTSEILIIIDH